MSTTSNQTPEKLVPRIINPTNKDLIFVTNVVDIESEEATLLAVASKNQDGAKFLASYIQEGIEQGFFETILTQEQIENACESFDLITLNTIRNVSFESIQPNQEYNNQIMSV